MKKIIIIGICILLLFSIAVAAQNSLEDKVKSSSAKFSQKIKDIFTKKNNQGPGAIDYLVFFTLFMAISWFGFSKLSKEEGQKGAIIMLSLAVATALTVGLVTGGKFTLKDALPFAVFIIFVIIFIGLFKAVDAVLAGKQKTATKSIIAFLIAAVLIFLLLSFMISSICANNRCDKSPLLKQWFGSNSFLGNNNIKSTSSIQNAKTPSGTIAIGNGQYIPVGSSVISQQEKIAIINKIDELIKQNSELKQELTSLKGADEDTLAKLVGEYEDQFDLLNRKKDKTDADLVELEELERRVSALNLLIEVRIREK